MTTALQWHVQMEPNVQLECDVLKTSRKEEKVEGPAEIPIPANVLVVQYQWSTQKQTDKSAIVSNLFMIFWDTDAHMWKFSVDFTS